MAQYIVTGPLALVKDQAGKIRYYYAGAVIPSDIDVKQRTRLVARGLVSEVADLTAPIVVATDLTASAPAIEASVTESSAPQRPAQVAAKSQWVDYAVARGADRSEAEALTKQDLVDAYSAAD